MKTFINFPVLSMALIGLLLFGCTKDPAPAPTPENECDNKSLLMLSTDYQNSPSVGIDYLNFDLSNLNQNNGVSIADYSNTDNLWVIMPANNSIYNKNDQLHGVKVKEKYYTLNLNSGSVSQNNIALEMVAPVFNGNTAYILELTTPYLLMGEDPSFEIREFNTQNGAIGNALPLNAAEKTFSNNSLFHHELISSTSDNSDQLFFIGGTNLLTVNTVNNTTQHVDLYPNFSGDDWMTFQGLEYSESLGLLALKRHNDDYSIVNIDPIAGTFTDLVAIPDNINTEFYATTYNECTKTFYLTTLDQSTTGSKLYEFDLNTNTLSNTENFSTYNFGIKVIEN